MVITFFALRSTGQIQQRYEVDKVENRVEDNVVVFRHHQYWYNLRRMRKRTGSLIAFKCQNPCVTVKTQWEFLIEVDISISVTE